MLRVERNGDIVVWTIARPQSKNALDMTTMHALWNAAAEASRDGTLRAAVLTGEGDSFVSGGDLRELRDRGTAQDAAVFSDLGQAMCRALEDLHFPVIAALAGPAFGGGAELAVACDLRVAEPHAKISFKQVRMGVTTGWGTIGRLMALVGSSTAARLLYTGHEVVAASAMAMGLVDAVVEKGGAVTQSLAWASDIALGSPVAVAEMKRLLRAARVDVSPLERDRFIATWSGPDHAEAMEAYFSRRPPRWTK
jgi:enoyl-CoA hydratase/carnithine racemase